MGEDRIDYLLGIARRVSDKLRSDPRIEAIWVCGSVGREEADEFSDLDVVVLIHETSFLEFVKESRNRKWASLGARFEYFRDGFTAQDNECKDSLMIDNTCLSVQYFTLDRIMNCGWNDLEHVEWVLGGILHSEVMHDPTKILEKLRGEFEVYPEQLRTNSSFY